MKFTDRFFSIPVRIYDRFSMKQAEEEEEKLNLPQEAKWTVGFHKIEHREIYSWGDYCDISPSVEEVNNDAEFLYTIVVLMDGTTYICTLNKKDFETKLNKYTEKWEAWRKEEDKIERQEEQNFLNSLEKGD